MSDQFNSDKAPEPVGLYPHARRVGELLFLSGVGPRERGTKDIPGVTLDDDGNIIAYNIETQCRSVFNNVKLILEASGSSWDQLVDVTVFLTNMKDDFRTYNRIYAEYFNDNQPCRTTVEINALPTPIAIELKCMATFNVEKESSYTEATETIVVPPPATDPTPEPPTKSIEVTPEPEASEPENTREAEQPTPPPTIQKSDSELGRDDRKSKPPTQQW